MMLCADMRGPGINVKTILTIIITIIIKNKKMLKISKSLRNPPRNVSRGVSLPSLTNMAQGLSSDTSVTSSPSA